MKRNRPLLLATAAALLASTLGACSREKPEEAPTDTMVNSSDEPVTVSEPDPVPVATPAPIETPVADTNSSAELDPEPITPPDEQMLDDASATGMTSRATRGEQSGETVTNAN